MRRLATVASTAAAVALAFEALPASAAAPSGDAGVVTDAGSATPDALPAPAIAPDSGVRPEHRRLKHVKGLGVPMTFQPAVLHPPVVAPVSMSDPGTPSTSVPISELGFNTCHKIPADKRAVKVNLKPDVELPELVAWISSITCKSFVLPGHLSGGGKKVTLVTQGAMTTDEAYAAFMTALDSVGLTVERHATYMKIIETSKAKTSSMPVYGFDGQPTRGKTSGSGD